MSRWRNLEGPSGRGPFLQVGYAGLIGFLVLDRLFRPGDAASLRATEADRGTTRMLTVAYAVATVLPPVIRRRPGRQLPVSIAVVGLLGQATGLGIRAWSMRSLGQFYSRTLQADDGGQPVVEIGPYRRIRHPGYAGSLLIWTGFACTSRRIPVVLAVPVLLGAIYRHRISIEEALLDSELSGYHDYRGRTKKLLPGIW
jgi:protein-S-isoprenylcysteine O-methyltransferase Ste14